MIKKILISLLCLSSFSFADILLNSVSKKNYNFEIYSDKNLVVGNNTLKMKIFNKDKDVTSSFKSKIKVFMPEMPSMPYMEYKNKGVFVDGLIKFNINLSMGGTWQYHIFVKSKNMKTKKIRGSLNL